jgi:hypothetical protein
VHRDVLEDVYLDIEIARDSTFPDVAEILHGKRSAVGAGLPWIVHQADILIEGQRDVLGSKFLWGQRSIAMKEAVFICPLPIKRRRRGAQMDREDAVDYVQDLVFGGAGVLP